MIAQMKGAKGATLVEVMKTTGWQPHMVGRFVGLQGKKGCEKIESSKSEDGQRTYRIK